ncbi:type II toxin-antitoxin system VapC family toxin [Sphingomonas qomolangmaensis]|uniref:Type II toxin-antitoxin system VapC family toxin n=1 Tax=Sphingomonas qomolangmaensis TaxID=2918765 RepID=A0ABY5L777_9SPHN|nr:type II toxin-antitoxin system VapC family toxin [Sphingomonas qomolangmaensis]UUL81737.1 type II toxin-antitoxin system VapC family toxin [Sphingomonas qomolangmaensis]
MTAFILDTHAVLFWWAGGQRLGASARTVLEESDAAFFVSAVSAWEVATKHRVGKLPDIGDPSVQYPRLMAANDFRSLDVTASHGLLAGTLAGEHRDPFDRLIAAQALIEDLTVVTRDREIANFGCKVLW